MGSREEGRLNTEDVKQLKNREPLRNRESADLSISTGTVCESFVQRVDENLDKNGQ